MLIPKMMPFPCSGCFCVCLLMQWVIQTNTRRVADLWKNSNQERHRPTIIQDKEMPPVVFDQSQGPVYIINPKDYYNVSCDVTEGASVQWTYNDQPLPSQNFFVNSSDGRSTLTFFDDTGSRMHGHVQCHVRNMYGSSFGEEIFIRHAVLRRILDTESIIKASEGDDVHLSCHLYIQHVPPARVRWVKGNSGNNTDIMSQENFMCNERNTTCILSDVTIKDTDDYTCKFYKFGKSVRKQFKVQVERKRTSDGDIIQPLNLIRDLTSPGVVKVQEGEKVALRCMFRGNDYNMKWTYKTAHHADERGITNGNKFSILKKGKMLLISDFSIDDQGYYSCIAENSYEAYEHRIEVKMVQAPVLETRILCVRAYAGETIRINCSTSYVDPEPRTQWWINSEPLVRGRFGSFHVEDDGQTLVLENASVGDTCSIVCKVSNDVGHVFGYRTVMVSPAPLSTSTPSVVTSSMDSQTSESSSRNTEMQVNSAEVPVKQLKKCPYFDIQANNLSSMAEILSSCSGDIETIIQLIKIQKQHKFEMDLRFWVLEDRIQQMNVTWNQLITQALNTSKTGANFISPSSMPETSKYVPYIIITELTHEKGLQLEENVDFSCSVPHGCEVSAHSITRQNVTSSRSRKSKIFHESRDITFFVEKKDIYSKSGDLVKVRSRFTTNRKSKKKCKAKDDLVLEIELNDPTKSSREDGHLNWSAIYNNPYKTLTNKEQNGTECSQQSNNKTKVKITVEDFSSQKVMCWSNKHGANIQLSIGGKNEISLCRLTHL